MTLLEVNVDDATGEQLAHAVAELLAAGAHDAWLTPIVMKKGRPAYTVSALADPSLAAQVAAVLTRETGSLGVRGQSLDAVAAEPTGRAGRRRRLPGAHQGGRRTGQGRARRRGAGGPPHRPLAPRGRGGGRGRVAPAGPQAPAEVPSIHGGHDHDTTTPTTAPMPSPCRRTTRRDTASWAAGTTGDVERVLMRSRWGGRLVRRAVHVGQNAKMGR